MEKKDEQLNKTSKKIIERNKKEKDLKKNELAWKNIAFQKFKKRKI